MREQTRRQSSRVACIIPIIIQTKPMPLRVKTGDVGRGGVFIASYQMKMLGEILSVDLMLPDREGHHKERVRTKAVVTWRRNPAMARKQGLQAGMGLKFLMIEQADRERWDRFVQDQQLEEGTGGGADSGQMTGGSAASESRPSPATTPPLQATQAPPEITRFCIRPASCRELLLFAQNELFVGRMFLRTPLIKAVGARLEIVLVHPDLGEEFLVPAQVMHCKQSTSITQRGMHVQFLERSEVLARRFMALMDRASPRMAS